MGGGLRPAKNLNGGDREHGFRGIIPSHTLRNDNGGGKKKRARRSTHASTPSIVPRSNPTSRGIPLQCRWSRWLLSTPPSYRSRVRHPPPPPPPSTLRPAVKGGRRRGNEDKSPLSSPATRGRRERTDFPATIRRPGLFPCGSSGGRCPPPPANTPGSHPCCALNTKRGRGGGWGEQNKHECRSTEGVP